MLGSAILPYLAVALMVGWLPIAVIGWIRSRRRLDAWAAEHGFELRSASGVAWWARGAFRSAYWNDVYRVVAVRDGAEKRGLVSMNNVFAFVRAPPTVHWDA